jgi:hypothetical protein
MEQNETIPQGLVALGRTLAAIGIVILLAITVPVLGIVAIPFVAVATLARTVATDLGAATKGWTADPRG